MTDDATGVSEFERVDWDAMGGVERVSRRDVGFLVSLGALLAAALYYHFEVEKTEPMPLVGGWDPLVVDWVFFVSLLVFGFYVLVPLAADRRALREYWSHLRGNYVALASLVWLAVFFVVGTFEPIVVGRIPTTHFHQPPFGIGVNELFVGSCQGQVVADKCFGSMTHVLGTTGGGKDLTLLTMAGMKTALEMALVTATIIVPLGIGVGTVAGYAGGRTDELLMRYVDAQQTVPALFIYMVAAVVYGPSLLLMIAVFGLLNWGNIARTIRSEVLRKRDLDYVRAARNAGAGRAQIIRRHIVPNVATTALTMTALKLPKLIIIEATLSYLNLGDPRVVSWGNVASVGVFAGQDPSLYWWVATVPIVALVITVIAISAFGNALQDVIEPRRREGTAE